MAEHFALNTGDPRFDPEQPLTVNGFLFVPAGPVHVKRRPVVEPMQRRREVVEAKRKNVRIF